MSNLVVFSFATPDLMMAGAALFAMLCGIVLMGGRSVIGWPLRMLLNLCNRSMQRETVACEPAVCLQFPRVDRVHERDVRSSQRVG